jgi:RED-like protein N-terminal region
MLVSKHLFLLNRSQLNFRILSDVFCKLPVRVDLQNPPAVPYLLMRLNRASIYMLVDIAVIFTSWQRKIIDSSETAFKPRKLKKQGDSKYRDRAAERRVGEGNDYAHVTHYFTAAAVNRCIHELFRLKPSMKNSKRKQQVAKTKRRQVGSVFMFREVH